MAGVKINSKGVVVEKGGSGLQIDLNLKGTNTQQTGSLVLSDGGIRLTRTSGSGDSAMVKVGSEPNLATADQVLLQISGAAGEGCRNAIMLFASGAHNGTNAAGAGGVTNGGGGAEGLFQAPPAGALYLYTDGVNLYMRNSSGAGVFLATSSAGAVI